RAGCPRDKTCGDALGPRALAVLGEMGLLPELTQAGCRVGGLEIAAPSGRAVCAPLPPAGGLPDYTLIVPRLALDDALRRRAEAAGTAFRGGVRVVGIERERDGAVVVAQHAGRAER